jgi:hypothetical protein
MSDQQWQAYASAVRRRALAREQWKEARRVLSAAHSRRAMGLCRDPHEVARAANAWKAACDELGEAAIAVSMAAREAGDSIIHVGGAQP